MTTPAHPKISVIMPVHNGEEHLRDAIESILHQTFREYEFLIMDDGSTDDTAKILESYAKKDRRIKIFTQKNRGIVKSLNTLATHAVGSLLARMDADDVCYANRLQAQYSYMEHHPQTVLLGTYARIIERKNAKPKGGCHFKQKWPKKWRRNTAFEEDVLNRWYLSIIPPFIHSGTMFRKKTFIDAGGYREEEYPAEDYGLWIRMKKFGKLNTVPEALMDYYLDGKGISARNYKKQIAKRDELNFINLEDLYENNEIPPAQKALELLKPYRLDAHQRQVLGKLACLTGCFYIEKNNYPKAKEYFKLCLKMDRRRFDAALNIILGKFKKAFLISVDQFPNRKKILFKIYWFPRRKISP